MTHPGWSSVPQYIVYRVEPSKTRPGKTDKIPIDPDARRPIDAQDRARWMTAEAATAALGRIPPDDARPHGVGFVLSDPSDYWFLDIDDCYVDDEWSPIAKELCGRLDGAYGEVSQSGKGLHLIGRGKPPPHGTRNQSLGLELYSRLRFCALTGTNARGSMEADFTPAIKAIAAQYFAPGPAATTPAEWTDSPCEGYGGPADDDDELIRVACRAQSASAAFGGGVAFKDLWEADEAALGRKWPDSGDTRAYDASAADMALAQHLAFWTGKDCARIERIMRQSALVRGKWDRADYLPRTILRACGQQR